MVTPTVAKKVGESMDVCSETQVSLDVRRPSGRSRGIRPPRAALDAWTRVINAPERSAFPAQGISLKSKHPQPYDCASASAGDAPTTKSPRSVTRANSAIENCRNRSTIWS